jgi:hypothetical protein
MKEFFVWSWDGWLVGLDGLTKYEININDMSWWKKKNCSSIVVDSILISSLILLKILRTMLKKSREINNIFLRY